MPRSGGVYWKVTVERPLRLQGVDPERPYKANEIKKLKSRPRPPSGDSAERSETAPPVIKKVHTRGVEADPLRGLFPATIRGKSAVVKYAPASDLRDTDQLSLTEAGGIAAFLHREVLPYTTAPWYGPSPSRSATRSASLATSTYRSRRGALEEIGRIYWRWSGSRQGCWGRPWEQHGRYFTSQCGVFCCSDSPDDHAGRHHTNGGEQPVL